MFGITSGQEPAVLWEAGCCMLLQDFTQLVALAEQHCAAAGNGSSERQGQQKQQQQGGKAGASAQNAALQVQITADTRQ